MNWIQVDREVGNQLGSDKFAEQSRFNKYAKADIHPNLTTRKLVNKRYPGTQAVYEYGPGRSHLWSALGPQPAVAMSAIEQEWRHGVVVRDTRESGERVEYRVVPGAIATHYKLSAKGSFPVVDARKLLQPWQRVDEYLGRWVSINSPLPGRRTLPLGPEPTRSMFRTRFAANKARNAVTLPSLAAMSYEIAHARCFGLGAMINPDLLTPYGVSLDDLGTLFVEIGLSWERRR